MKPDKIRKVADQLEKANSQLQDDNENLNNRFNESEAYILLNDSWVIYYPVDIHVDSAYKWGAIRLPDRKNTSGFVAEVNMSWVRSVKFIPSHGV